MAINYTGMKEISCPGCGKEIHTYSVPTKPGQYRVRCHSNRDRVIVLEVHNDGSVTGTIQE